MIRYSITICASLCLFLTACVTEKTKFKPIESSGLSNLIPGVLLKKIKDQYIADGVQALEKGDLKRANESFNKAIKHDPRNPHIHFLNALTYQLRGEISDSTHFETAEAGYRISMQFDPRNWMAAYQLGHLKFQQQRYREAQNAFSYGLLYKPENTEMLQALATSSYFAQDLETAYSSLKKVFKLRDPTANDLASVTMIQAAMGNFDASGFHLKNLKKIDRRSIPIERIAGRIEDWKRFYKRNPNIKVAQLSDGTSLNTSVLSSEDTSAGLSDTKGTSSISNTKNNGKAKETPKMTLVDVVIIRTEERHTTAKGLNLLNGLQATLTGDLFDLQRGNTKDFLNSANDVNTRQADVNFKVSLPSGGLTYNLNIFNDTEDRNEILARPTLVALDGKPSEFFSGSVFHVELDGVVGSQGTVTDVPVGIRMALTPKFINEKTVQINVEAARAFLEARSTQAGFGNFSQVSKTRIAANVVMNFGETLVLSGLSEKEEEILKDGVPILQDIPGLQYFFSHQDTLEFTKSVLILITPRKPRYTYQEGTEKVSRENPPEKNTDLANLKELKNRPDWFKPAENLDSVFIHLNKHKYYKEFQTGDVKIERWEDSRKLETKIKRTLEFLYY